MPPTGSAQTRLIVLRGNSASGKSTLAQAIRAARPREIAILGQDQLRREILHLRDRPGNLAVSYIDLSARYALDGGLHVVVDGILAAAIYGQMLTGLIRDHQGLSCCYRYELAFEETLRRHASKAPTDEYGEDEMRTWWLEQDPLPGIAETPIGAATTLEEALVTVLRDCGWEH